LLIRFIVAVAVVAACSGVEARNATDTPMNTHFLIAGFLPETVCPILCVGSERPQTLIARG
jgi:hypothetical protein